MDEVIVNGMPESLRRYIIEECMIPAVAFNLLPEEKIPEPARSLLVHKHDMTSTLEKYHQGKLFVERIQKFE